MEAEKSSTFRTMSENVGQFNLRGKTFLIPEMNRIGAHLLAGTFRSFGVNARVMETYKGLDLGKEFTSGKECFPCQVTMGDILFFLQEEKRRLGTDFDPEEYIYFMPEAEGPCRFGMYNKYQRIVLDAFPELERVKIGSLTSKNSYALDGMIDRGKTRDFRKAGYFSVVIADILDRLLWRIRPYEKKEGIADGFMEKAMMTMAEAFESHGAGRSFDKILDGLEEIIDEGKAIIDPSVPPKPLIGIVGEIYVRSQKYSNNFIEKKLEELGCEVYLPSIAEWFFYTNFTRVRNCRWFQENRRALFTKVFNAYMTWRHNTLYRLFNIPSEADVTKLLNHASGLVHHTYEGETVLTIGKTMECIHDNFAGVINVMPFTCMPGNIVSTVYKRVKDTYPDFPLFNLSLDGLEHGVDSMRLETFANQARNYQYHHIEI